VLLTIIVAVALLLLWPFVPFVPLIATFIVMRVQ
jgi:hypothetical protein